MSVEAIYQTRVLALARAENGAGLLAVPGARATIDNPLCGDRITLDLAFDGTIVAAIGHEVHGCALCRAAASLIGAGAVGTGAADLRRLADAAQAVLHDDAPAPPDWPDLDAFRPVAAMRSRHRCVLLPFEALIAALDEMQARHGA